MASLKAHFDGHSIVLDEPATLAVEQAVRVIVEPPPAVSPAEAPVRPSSQQAAVSPAEPPI